VLAEEAFGRQNRYTTQCTLAEALTGLGQYQAARTLLTRTIADYVSSGDQSFRWFMHEALADCCAQLGDYETAYREQKEARKWFAANVNRQSSKRFEALDSHYRISLAEAEARQLRDDNVVLQAAARTDALTGLPNRRVLYETLQQRCAARQPIGVLVIDADHFKRVNDLFSHLVGDTVLTRLAHIFTDVLRAEDLIARFGGEEFVGVVATHTLTHAVDLAERLRVAVEGAPWSDVALGLTVTISIGVTQLRSGDLANDLLARADASLLHAKTSGRNRVIAHPVEQTVP
jgi:diguanylate cyclase (GGDEF)-like protein